MKLTCRHVQVCWLAPLLAFAASTSAQIKWDLPAAYPTSNFHTENLIRFEQDVEKGTGGKLKITVYANASPFKANEIKRAVQGGQAQIGEVLLGNFENENPIYGTEGLPFLAASYADAKKLAEVQKPALDKLLGGQGIKLLYAVSWPPQGMYVNKEVASGKTATPPPGPRSRGGDARPDRVEHARHPALNPAPRPAFRCTPRRATGSPP